MKTSKILLGIVVVLTLIVGAAAADSPNIDPSIFAVAQGGSWRSGAQYGTWRLVVQTMGWEETRSLVYLQWLVSDDSKKAQFDRLTVPIKEINEGEWANIESVNYRVGSFHLVYRYWGSRETRRQCTITPDVPGTYSFVQE